MAGRPPILDADVVVIGGGAAGLTAAEHAARRGARVTLVSEGPLGGECTHTGCVPSKALLSAAAAGRSFGAAMADVRAAIRRIAASEDEGILARRGVRVIRGRAELEAAGRVVVDGSPLRTSHTIIATGSAPAVPPIPGLVDIAASTNETVFDLPHRPRTLAVVGGGAVGCELAQAFARLGSAVTVIEATPRLLPGEDPDASVVVTTALRADGVGVHTGHRILEASRSDQQRRLDLEDGTAVVAEEVLVAAGRRPVTDGLGLERVGVALDPGGRIVVDDTCATSVAGVWAVGDVTDLGGFTHVAGHMGHVAAMNVTRTSRLRPRATVDRRTVPRVTFTDPEVAAVGVTEHDAPAGARVAEVRFEHVDRGVTSGRQEGFVKLVAGRRRLLGGVGGGQILGATIVGPRAGEMLAEVALAMRTRAFTGRLAQTMHAYPTWSMAVQQAATGFFFDSDDVVVRTVSG